MNARPHLNGNSPQDFMTAGMSLNKAVGDFRKSLLESISQTMHGRNYQHLSTSEARVARDVDMNRIQAIMSKLGDCEALANEMFFVGEKSR